MKLGCIVMACGVGKRFVAAGGVGPKLLACAGGVPLVVMTLRSVPADTFEIVQTVAHQEVQRVCAALQPTVHQVVVAGSPVARSSSIQAGLAVGAQRWDGALFLPGDQPLVRTESFAALAVAFERNPSRAYRLAWEGSMGSPVLFPRASFDALFQLKGSQGGLFALKRSGIEIAAVNAQDPSELWDVDTPLDLQRVAECIPAS